MTLFLTFFALNVVNVILQTIKSILTVKGSRFAAAFMNATAYFVYTIILCYMSCELSTLTKAAIVGGINFVCVYLVKAIEEKVFAKKDNSKFKIDLTAKEADKIKSLLNENGLSYNFTEMANNYTTFYVYDVTKTQIEFLKNSLSDYDVNLSCYRTV